MKITVKDIARLSGVSKGTVDRVLHNREGVSKKSYAKVMKVVRESGYEPNVYASLLARHEERIIAVLMPSSSEGDYWSLIAEGIAKTAPAAGNFGLIIKTVGYDQYNLDSFLAACEDVIAMRPAGVILPPMFKIETLTFAGKLKQLNIPYVYIDSKIDDPGYLAFFGMPAYRAGYLCAAILTDDGNVSGVGAVRVIRDKKRHSDPTKNRRSGCLDFLEEFFPNCKKEAVFVNPAEPEKIEPTLDAFFAANPEISHLLMFNSRLYLIVPWLRKHPERKLRIIGFDNLPANVDALREGLVTVLITQRPEEQIHGAIDALINYIVFGREPAVRDNFMHMDILTRFNLD